MRLANQRRVIPEIGDWDAMRAAFRWNIPKHFNIAEACCDSWARIQPDRTAIVHYDADYRDKSWTYGALKDASDRFASVLDSQGVGQGDRVAVLLPQCPEVMIAHFAAMKLGAVGLPLFTLFGPDALTYRLSDSASKVIVTDDENLEKVLELTPNLPDLIRVYSIGSTRAPARAMWQDIEQARPIANPVTTNADDPAILIYTSGTTGPPKGVLHAHRFLFGHLPSMECHHEGFPEPGDCGWTPADWAWIGGLMDMAIPSLYYGVPLISHRMRKFSPDAAYHLINRSGARNLFLPPTALKIMRQSPVPDGIEIRSIGSGGESLGSGLLDWARDSFGVPINEIYGQTECNLVLASCAGSMEVKPSSMGRAVPGFDVAIIDHDGQPLPPGTTGEIAVKAPNPVMFLRYLNKPEATAAKYVNEWLRTGDLGQMDGQGYFTFQSRDDDVITSAGYRIGPSEIENCLTGDADVVMAAAVGVPDPVRTEVVKAFVVLRQGADRAGLEARLQARVRQNVSPHVAPKLIEVIDEMPMTATGKIMRRTLRDRG